MNFQKLIAQYDLGNVFDSIQVFSQQIPHAWELSNSQLKTVELKTENLNNILVCGMGGSALGARVVKSLSHETLDLPLNIVNDYHLPDYVDQNTLVILSSYSGNTEEVVTCTKQAINRKAQIIAVTTGGKLLSQAHRHRFPVIKIDPQHNPSGQPRMAIGYSVIAQMAILAKFDLIKLSDSQIGQINKAVQQISPIKTQNIALKLRKKLPILVAAEHLVGAIHVTKNQLNENAKTFAASFAIPELNHHLMEGLKFPISNKKNLIFIFYQSDLYHPRNQKRIKLTQKVLKKAGISSIELNFKGATRLIQTFEIIQFGNYYNFYLALLNKVNPAPIPTVGWFKKQLK